MTNTDELRELFYSSQDPQFRDEESEIQREEKEMYLKRLQEAHDSVEEAALSLSLAANLADSPAGRDLIEKYTTQLDMLTTQLEKLL